MQFLYSALSSDQLRALYILLPRHTWTHQHLKGVYSPDTHYTASCVINVHSFLCVLPGSHFTTE